MFGAIAEAEPGDVVVLACDAFTATFQFRRPCAGMMRNKGVAAFVTDGLARDRAGILATGLPVYCMGITPNSAALNGPGTVARRSRWAACTSVRRRDRGRRRRRGGGGPATGWSRCSRPSTASAPPRWRWSGRCAAGLRSPEAARRLVAARARAGVRHHPRADMAEIPSYLSRSIPTPRCPREENSHAQPPHRRCRSRTPRCFRQTTTSTASGSRPTPARPWWLKNPATGEPIGEVPRTWAPRDPPRHRAPPPRAPAWRALLAKETAPPSCAKRVRTHAPTPTILR